jgi:hypothetical protein
MKPLQKKKLSGEEAENLTVSKPFSEKQTYHSSIGTMVKDRKPLQSVQM